MRTNPPFVPLRLLAAGALALGCADTVTAGAARDAPAACFEIFPSVTPESAAVTPPRAHANPTEFQLATTVGTRAEATVRYYNFCADPDPRLLAVESTGADGGALDASFSVESLVAVGSRVETGFAPHLRVAFLPRAAGTYRARVRWRFAHGYYDTLVTATARE